MPSALTFLRDATKKNASLGEEAMIAVRDLVCGATALMATMGAMGCGSQSAAFRQMSAAEHENAARLAQGDAEQSQEHLAAAKRLRDQEQVACYGVPDSDRIQGPFAHPNEVTSVEVLRDRGVFPKGPLEPVGVAVNLRAEPGMTQQWLGRVVACHMAHIAVAGPDPQPSPLSVANTQVAVTPTAVGFRVTVVAPAHDLDVARSVVDKGQQLADSTFGRGSPQPSSMASAR
jgi:hypothetical protein